MSTCYVALHFWWSRVEVPRGCFAELPPSLYYIASKLIKNPQPGYWSLVVENWSARTAVQGLWKAYDLFRLFYIPLVLWSVIRTLDLYIPLGSEENWDELLSFPDVMDGVDWELVSVTNQPDGCFSEYDRSLWRPSTHSGVFVYYNP